MKRKEQIISSMSVVEMEFQQDYCVTILSVDERIKGQNKAYTRYDITKSAANIERTATTNNEKNINVFFSAASCIAAIASATSLYAVHVNVHSPFAII